MLLGTDENWPAWTVGIARNKIRRELQRQWARQRRESERHDGDAYSVGHLGEGADVIVVNALVSRRIYRRLSPAQRELFDLAHLRGLTVNQAASALGISSTAYTTRVSRLRALIERLCKEEQP